MAVQSASTGVSAIILAAGKAERMGSNKLALPLFGQSVLSRVIAACLASKLDSVIVVLGRYVEELLPEIPSDPRVKTVWNENYEIGQHSSLQVGLRALDGDPQAAVVLLGDQPLISATVIDSLIDQFEANQAPIIVPTYGGINGHPVLFSCQLFPELLAASESAGRRSVMQNHQSETTYLPVAGSDLKDLDTPEDYQEMVAAVEKSGE